MGMWTDQLTADHNGGPPYQTARALQAIPRDTWMFNWSSSLAPLHTYELADLGFETVLEANSYRHQSRARAGRARQLRGLVGQAAVAGGDRCRPSEYDYQKLIHGAEYGWRLHPDLAEPKPHPGREFALAVREVEAAAATQPEPAAGTALTPLAAPPAGVDLSAWLSGSASLAMVPHWPRGLALGESLPVGRRAASLWWWQLLDADGAALEAIREGLKDPRTWWVCRSERCESLRRRHQRRGGRQVRVGHPSGPARGAARGVRSGVVGVVGETAIYCGSGSIRIRRRSSTA